ncbi:ATP-dependent endonuclease [Erysipelothrix rhusiopathiae]|nr:ATP-dependent endonuclease [Erysipelothrix rhusiopathiae]MDE8069282.1 ATP-dependent endonuclease [Erysipelothrix rhusiopathiae]MDE8074023.1 ATP-dependent endonuclease [Erysipelothrix rhusiopathiae]MDE8075750.1 ATP-dependent endonuclease [Erysipelothrix rhusiopathiae]MDE8117861.1 ATP-dependent endonuclease [Erysipelothrix rhusiopathiae]
MKIEYVQVKNFRMLQDLEIDFQENLSLILGKNNSGKTSFLSILNKFLSENNPVFTFDDFSIESQKKLLRLENTRLNPEEYSEISISLKLFIKYELTENIGNASKLLLDLDDKKQYLVIYFQHLLEYEKYLKLISDFNKHTDKGIKRDFDYFIRKNFSKYFSTKITALEYENEVNFKVIDSKIVRSIISLQTIGAKRDVENEQGRGKSLSMLASKYYDASVSSDLEFPDLQNQLQSTDENLTNTYKDLFNPVIQEIKEMSYNPNEAEISILSSLSEKKIFQENTIVKYKHGESLLPEDYNGLGYLNLFAIVFNIRIKLDKLSKKNNSDEIPTPINLLFIEEPEAHTHPQMQYVFIKNIKHILRKHCESIGENFSLQTIISTHSSHIVSQCEFEDIKYFYRISEYSVQSRSLSKLHSKMPFSQVKLLDGELTEEEQASMREEQEKNYRFLKQYITLGRSELFFADKVILVEGDTERMLLSAMMDKTDSKCKDEDNYVPLLSQNISIIEVGAYSHIFATFLGFIGIKTLIITDLDCAKIGKNGRANKCSFVEASITTNASIKYFLKKDKIQEIIEASKKPITFFYDEDESSWNLSEHGTMRLLFQVEENGYQPRSFEDSFVCNNLQFIFSNKEKFVSLKNRDQILEDSTDFYGIAENCIDSKTSFALDLLLYENNDDSNWKVPLYIEEGLRWLAQ